MNYYYISTILLIIISFIFLQTLLVTAWKKMQPRGMSDEEKIAMSKRVLENLNTITLYLVTEAENIYGKNSGKLKQAWVMDQLYSRIPEVFKPYITENNLKVILELTLDSAKILWEENKNLLKKY